MSHYITDGHGNVQKVTAQEFYAWDSENNRRVGFHEEGSRSVSTVFLGMQHGEQNGKPILWETLTFGSGREHMRRAASLKQARVDHAEVCCLVFKGQFLDYYQPEWFLDLLMDHYGEGIMGPVFDMIEEMV